MNLVLFLLVAISHGTEVPNFLRSLDSERDRAAINENFRALSNGLRLLEVSSGTASQSTSSTASNTFTGATVFVDTVSFQSQVGFNGFTTSNTAVFSSSIVITNVSGGATVGSVVSYKMKSIDGDTQAAGCTVVVGVDANSDTAALTFTSTVTAAVDAPLGVLTESCAPAAYCNVAVLGPVRVNCEAGSTAGKALRTTTTRCRTLAGATAGPGMTMTSDSSNLCVVFMGIER